MVQSLTTILIIASFSWKMAKLTKINTHSLLLQLSVRNLLSRITGISKESRETINNGIKNQWIKQIGVYGLDDTNHCRIGLKLTINWTVHTIHVLVLGDKETIVEAVSMEDELPPDFGNAISSVFNQAVEAEHLRIEWYCRYEQGLDPVAINKELGVIVAPPKGSELPELEDTLKGFSPANDPSEYREALLQHLYALDILTQSLSNIHGYPTNPTDDNSHLKAEGLPHVTELRAQADLGRETTHEAEQARAVRRHVEQLREEAKIPQGIIIYQRGTLPKNYERHAKQLVEAIGNQQHRLRQPTEQLLRRFAAAAAKDRATDIVKDKGILIEQASRKYGIPARTLASWGEMDLIPVLHKRMKATYLDEEAVAQAAQVYREAKQQGAQPARLLKAMRAQQAEGNLQSSR
jgi:hypothetical protein